MRFHSPLLTFAALVLFGLGSVGAPVLHRAAHAVDGHDAHAAHEVTDAHVHGDGVGVTGALPEWMDLDDACALCQVHLSSVDAGLGYGLVAPEHAIAHSSAPGRASVAAPALRPVRGPPV